MENLPLDILAPICTNLKIENMLSLATTNTYFRSTFITVTVKNQIVDLLAFPRELELKDLKHLESMSLNERLEEASKTGNKRLVERLIELGANDYEKAMKKAIENEYDEITDMLMTTDLSSSAGSKVNYDEISCVALTVNNKTLLGKIFEKTQDSNLTCNFDSVSLYIAADGNSVAFSNLLDLHVSEDEDSLFKIKNATLDDLCTVAASKGHLGIVMLILRMK